MKILITIGSASGVINHTLALSHLLSKEGGHEVIWLTGEDSREHLNLMDTPYFTYYSSEHNLKFNANNPGKVPHFIYSCSYNYLKKCTQYEVDLIRQIKPDFIITKHHYSPTISSRVCKIPHVYYYTDGAEYLFPERNPHNRWNSNTMINDYINVCKEFKLETETKKYPTEYLVSSKLNIIRGIPLLSSLTEKELSDIENMKCNFGGVLTYDGPQEKFSGSVENISFDKPLVYITFGTHSYPKDQLEAVLESLLSLEVRVLVSTGSLEPEDFVSFPSNVFFRKYVPNDLIMTKTSLVIHHAGYGTTLTSFFHGVPQLSIPNNPNYSAQLCHVDVIQKHRCGEYIPYNKLNIEKLSQVIKSLLFNKSYRNNARELQKKIEIQNTFCKQDILKCIDERFA